MTIKELFIIVAAMSEENKAIGDTPILLQTEEGCWLEADTMAWTEDSEGRNCLVLSAEGGEQCE